MSNTAEHLRPDERNVLSMDEFARTAGLSAKDIRELIEYGLLAPEELDAQRAFALRKAAGLKNDFDLDLFTTGLLAAYVAQTMELQAEVRQLRAERPGAVVYTSVLFSAVELSRNG